MTAAVGGDQAAYFTGTAVLAARPVHGHSYYYQMEQTIKLPGVIVAPDADSGIEDYFFCVQILSVSHLALQKRAIPSFMDPIFVECDICERQVFSTGVEPRPVIGAIQHNRIDGETSGVIRLLDRPTIPVAQGRYEEIGLKLSTFNRSMMSFSGAILEHHSAPLMVRFSVFRRFKKNKKQ